MAAVMGVPLKGAAMGGRARHLSSMSMLLVGEFSSCSELTNKFFQLMALFFSLAEKPLMSLDLD